MTLIKVHNGKWDTDIDLIDPLSPVDQHLYTKDYGMISSFLGIDTEFLVKEDGRIIWPWEVGLPQERQPHNPKASDLRGLFDFHGDGYITELCAKPSYCLEILLHNLSLSFQWLSGYGVKRKTTISAPAIYDIPPEIETSAPDDAKRLGCMPSFNVYGDAGNPSSLPSNKRTTGCHLHISHPVLQDESVAIALIKWADILVGCTWTYISPNPSSTESDRRKAYGRAGEHRLKKYETWPASDTKSAYSCGVEYRVLPGTVMQHPAYLTLMFSLYRSAMRLAAKYGEPQEALSMAAKEAINSADRKAAKQVVRSLPLSSGGRKLIRYFRRVPMLAENILDWYTLAANKKGHATTFESTSLADRSLSI